MKKVKITVMKQTVYQDLIDKEGWMKNKKLVIISCNDSASNGFI